jgi:hypothetical protein
VEDQKKEPIKPVINASAREQKEPLGKKLKRIFLSEDIDNVGSYVFIEVLVPALKDLCAKLIENTVNIALFGNGARPLNRGNNQQRSAALYWNSSVGQTRPFASQQRSSVPKSSNNFRDLIYDTKAEAERVLDSMVELISTYGVCTVQDLYSLSNMESNNYTNNDFGWMDLKGSRIIRVRDGWLLELPKPVLID